MTLGCFYAIILQGDWTSCGLSSMRLHSSYRLTEITALLFVYFMCDLRRMLSATPKIFNKARRRNGVTDVLLEQALYNGTAISAQ